MPIATLMRRRLPANAVFSGWTAAWLHGLVGRLDRPLEVTLPRLSTTSRLSGVSVSRSDLTSGDMVSIQDVAATSLVRTLADVARRKPMIDAVPILDLAMHRGLVSSEELHHWAKDHHHHWGVGRLVEAAELADAAAESPMESRLRLVLVSNGLPKPELQPPLYDATGAFVARPDLFYRSARLAIEYDGAMHRTTLAADNRRQNRLLEAGYQLLRFTASDVLLTPASVARQVRALLDRFAELPAARFG